jgi:DNA-binding protein HU-beta
LSSAVGAISPLAGLRNKPVNIAVVYESQAGFANTVHGNESGGIDMSKPMTKSELISQIAEHSELKKSDVKGVMETLATIGYKELKKNGSFLVPGFAKFVVIKKPATKARDGINPFTKEPTVFKAKPARKIIRARPVKAAKDAV